MNVGLDVMGHVAYWHILKQQSYSTLKLHLKDCHGIWRNETTIGRYIDRFSLLCENSFTLYIPLLFDGG